MKTVHYHRKLNKDNKLTKVIYENYLRKTMPCSFQCCSTYSHTSKTYKTEHYVIPSKKALTTYLPLFIDKNINTIILSSTLEQIRIESLNEYKRITEAIKNKFVFYNNFFEETFVCQMNTNITYSERNAENFEALISDFEDEYEFKCIERVIEYYTKHTNKRMIIATLNNIHLLPSLYNNSDEIKDLITKSLKEKTTYDDYYNEEKLNILCQQGVVYKGILYVNTHNCYSGIMHAEYRGKQIRFKIIGRNNMNRALNLDGVYVEIISKDEADVDLVDNETMTNKEKQDIISENSQISKQQEGSESIPLTKNTQPNKNLVLTENEVYGKVVGLFKRDCRSVIGTIDKTSINGSGPQFVLVIPLDKKIPKIRIRTSQIDEIEEKRIMVRINEWEKDSFYPFGSYVKCIGRVGDERTEIESILFSNGIDYVNYDKIYGIETVIKNLRSKIEEFEANKLSSDCNKKVKNNLTSNNNKINEPGIAHDTLDETIDNIDILQNELQNVYNQVLQYECQVREDIRKLDVLSIDPPGCTDIDDALHCRKVGELIEVGVHIADVSYFVEKDSLLDTEALKRGTTVYLTDRRFDMLPNYLSSDLCSLIAEKDRLAFSVFIYFDQDFQIKSTSFKKTVIRSKKSFTYEQAQNEMVAGKYKDSIKILRDISRTLKDKRIASGALELSSTELKIYTKPNIYRKNRNCKSKEANAYSREFDDTNDTSMKNELPEIEKIEQKVQHETNSLVEEFMLLANILVANELYTHHKDSAMLRRHPKFADDSFDELKEYLSKKNIDLNFLTSKELNDSIAKIEDSQFKELIKKLITRSMNQAVYFSSGSVPFDDFLHYGLALTIYTHFTSPIRRYADLIVHRQLEAVIEQKNDIYDNEKIEEICKTINFRKRNAMYANLDCEKLFVYLYLKGKVLEEMGYILKVRKNGVVVYIPSLGIEDIIKLDYEFDETKNTFIKDGNPIYKLYEYVKVRVQENDEKFFIDRHFDIDIIEN